MRRSSIVLMLCLLAMVGAWLFWPHNVQVPTRDEGVAATGGSAATAAEAVKLSATKAPGTASVKPALPTLNTNKLAFRLANTTNSFKQLQATPHAILLANAFIDTEKPLDLKIPAHLKAAGDPGAYIVQARSVTDARFRATLAAAGATEDT